MLNKFNLMYHYPVMLNRKIFNFQAVIRQTLNHTGFFEVSEYFYFFGNYYYYVVSVHKKIRVTVAPLRGLVIVSLFQTKFYFGDFNNCNVFVCILIITVCFLYFFYKLFNCTEETAARHFNNIFFSCFKKSRCSI